MRQRRLLETPSDTNAYCADRRRDSRVRSGRSAMARGMDSLPYPSPSRRREAAGEPTRRPSERYRLDALSHESRPVLREATYNQPLEAASETRKLTTSNTA